MVSLLARLTLLQRRTLQKVERDFIFIFITFCALSRHYKSLKKIYFFLNARDDAVFFEPPSTITPKQLKNTVRIQRAQSTCTTTLGNTAVQ